MNGSYTSQPFAFPGTPRRYARDRVVDILRIHLTMDLDLDRQVIEGIARHNFVSLRDGLGSLKLDAAEMEVLAVKDVSGAALDFTHDGETIQISLSNKMERGDEGCMQIDYRVTKPRRGFYFIQPDEGYPDRPVHAWSQGQDEDSKYWWPCFDYPNERAATEMVATVPEGFFALSNGELVERTKIEGNKERFHWRQRDSHVAYLVTLAVGKFETIEETIDLPSGRKLPLSCHVLEGRSEEGARAVEGTAEMVQLFSQKTGVEYPWEKYAQVFVSEFVFGGMENTSATTMTDDLLRDARAAIDSDSEDIVAHELAHQWFGDLVTCRDWSQAWLNEGFATFLEVVWKENKHGYDEACWLLEALARNYRDEARDRYVRPIMCHTYDEPIDLFDAHLYLKGAWVLHALRNQLGEDDFWACVQKYLETNRERGLVEVDDLRRAIEQVTGRSMDGFFDQWVKGAGIPSLEVTADWDAEEKQLTIGIAQKQKGDGVTEVFELETSVAVATSGGWKTVPVSMKRREQEIQVELDTAPLAVAFDPDWSFLHDRSFERPVGWRTHQLQNGPTAASRADAAADLAGEGSIQAVQALLEAVQNETESWGVRREAALSLGATAGTAARDALIESLNVKHPKARRAVVQALGGFRDSVAFDALAKLFREGDESYLVEAESLRSAGKTRSEGAYELLQEGLERPSWNEIVRSAALDGLAALGDPRGVESILEWTQYGRHHRARTVATQALGAVGWADRPLRNKARLRLEELCFDPNFRVSDAAAVALGSLGEASASGTLARLADAATDGRLKRAARESIRSLSEEGSAAARIRTLQGSLDRAREQISNLRSRVEKLENSPSTDS